jgi:hypothetical protein
MTLWLEKKYRDCPKWVKVVQPCCQRRQWFKDNAGSAMKIAEKADVKKGVSRRDTTVVVELLGRRTMGARCL